MTRDTFSLIVSLLGTIAGIFSIVVSYLTIGIESDKKKKQWYWVVFIIIIFITLANGIFIQSYDFRNEYDCMNSTDALVEAERYYVIGDYVYAAMIYESDSLRTEAIALSNLAYMYENGIGIEKNLEKAEELYRKSSLLGNEDALKNYIYFVLNNPRSFEQIFDVLSQGCEIKDEAIMRYITRYMYEGNVDMLHEDEYSMYIKKFWEMSDNERKKMIGQYMYDIEIPYDYYSGIKESEFVVCKEESREIKIHTGYECWGEGEEKNVQPLYTTVEQLFLMVHEKKLLNYDDFETKYIVVTK